jgi:hypothetical protein
LSAAQLRSLLAPHVSPQGVPVELHVTNHTARYRVALGNRFNIKPSEQLKQTLAQSRAGLAMELVY